MDAKSCYCTRKNCPRNKIQILDDESSQKSSERDYEDKETQKTPEMSSDNQTIHVDMKNVYKCMEHPSLFRGCLMQVAIINQSLLKEFTLPREKKKRFPQTINIAPLHFELPMELCISGDTVRILEKPNDNATNHIKDDSFEFSLKNSPSFANCEKFYSCESLLDALEVHREAPIKKTQTVNSQNKFKCQCRLRWKKMLRMISQSQGSLFPGRMCKSEDDVFRDEEDKNSNISISNQTTYAKPSVHFLNGFQSYSSKSKITPSFSIELENPQLQDSRRNFGHTQSVSDELIPATYDLKENLIAKPLTSQNPHLQVYRKALPQHKDIEICVKCRFDPSPLMDEEGNVFCPGNCGCCLCPWKSRANANFENDLKHSKIKICKCLHRTNLFDNLPEVQSICSQTSYFDLCPCRERAEAKYLEMYGKEMWKKSERLRNLRYGEKVYLIDVQELRPDRPGSKRFLASKMYNEL
ncbi:uncharacterized protein LOC142220029 [Haematobia irritans]|uniref:uncharacterized protein LOC142220029 n=1 Tax=Haematobia irritans TaxID=7368 RepID=UPI003F500BE7